MFDVPCEFPLATVRCRVQNRAMPRREKMSPDSSRRSLAKTEEMRKLIHSFRGRFKLNTSGKSFSQWWAELNREEKELEEKRFQRLAALGLRTKPPG